MRREEHGALHLEVISAIPGRIRLTLEKPIENDSPFWAIRGVKTCRYNPRIRTLLCLYDKERIGEEELIVRIGAIYAGLAGTKLLHVKRSEEEGFSMAASGYLALGCIALDGVMTAAASPLTQVTRWLSAGATLGAVVEHGYQELHVRGSFDPEVMSVVYLINAIGKTNGFQASLLAWIVTFGRHLIPQAPREQVYLVRRSAGAVILTPVVSGESKRAFAGDMLRSGVEALARKPT
ncbi:MAG: hypothetical protein Q4G52_07410 [Clostridia bacterium]|nr:hypothetical protein [Clostridia bacterium]